MKTIIPLQALVVDKPSRATFRFFVTCVLLFGSSCWFVKKTLITVLHHVFFDDLIFWSSLLFISQFSIFLLVCPESRLVFQIRSNKAFLRTVLMPRQQAEGDNITFCKAPFFYVSILNFWSFALLLCCFLLSASVINSDHWTTAYLACLLGYCFSLLTYFSTCNGKNALRDCISLRNHVVFCKQADSLRTPHKQWLPEVVLCLLKPILAVGYLLGFAATGSAFLVAYRHIFLRHVEGKPEVGNEWVHLCIFLVDSVLWFCMIPFVFGTIPKWVVDKLSRKHVLARWKYERRCRYTLCGLALQPILVFVGVLALKLLSNTDANSLSFSLGDSFPVSHSYNSESSNHVESVASGKPTVSDDCSVDHSQSTSAADKANPYIVSLRSKTSAQRASLVNREMDRKLAAVDLSPAYAEEMIANHVHTSARRSAEDNIT